MSPELLDPKRFGLDKSHHTRESDCYALGMVIYGILSGCEPFGTDNSLTIISKVLDDKRPERPQGEEGVLFTDAIWGIVQLCWKTVPSERANVKDVLLCLGGSCGDSRA